jgi:ribosomal protein L37AE/L43A
MAVPAGPPLVSCFRCGAPGVWHAQAHQWGCDRCRQLIGGPPQFPPPPPVTPWAGAPPAFAGQPTPKCPRCWGDGTWHPQAGKWGCDRCKSFLDPALATPVQANPNDFGVKMAKALLWIVLIIALIALKVWIRKQ